MARRTLRIIATQVRQEHVRAGTQLTRVGHE